MLERTKTFFNYLFKFIFVFAVVSNSLWAQQTKISLTSGTKILPCYFISNFEKNSKFFSKNKEVVALLETAKGEVKFTDKGVYFGIPLPKEEIKIYSKKDLVKNLKEHTLKHTNFVVMNLEFGGKFLRNTKIQPLLENKTNVKINIFKGKRQNWKQNIDTYKVLKYPSVWENIDVEFWGYMDKLEYKIIVQPYGNVEDVVLNISADSLNLDSQNNLIAKFKEATLKMTRPFAYQIINGEKVPVSVEYLILSNGEFGFKVGNYDKSKVLIIDPYLIWGTYFGNEGGGDDFPGWQVVVDKEDNIFLVGYTNSYNFPISENAVSNSINGQYDVFVTKLSKDGKNILYSTFIGGNKNDYCMSLVVDEQGCLYGVGYTDSGDFPVKSVSADSKNESLSNYHGGNDVFVFKLNASGDELIYSILIGGDYNDVGMDIALDSSNNVYVVGKTNSLNFPTTPDSYQKSFSYDDEYELDNQPSDAFVAKISSSGKELVYSTFLKGGRWAVAYAVTVDYDGCAYVVGEGLFKSTEGTFAYEYDNLRGSFLLKLNSSGSDLDFCIGNMSAKNYQNDYAVDVVLDNDLNIYVVGTYYDVAWGSVDMVGYVAKITNDGSNRLFLREYSRNNTCFTALAVDSEQNVYVVGTTSSKYFENFTFNCRGDGWNVVLLKYDKDGERIYEKGLCGAKDDFVSAIALDSDDNIIILGGTQSSDFPVTENVFDNSFNGNMDVFITKVSNDGEQMLFSTFLGGYGGDFGQSIDVDNSGCPYVVGYTFSPEFPTVEGSYKLEKQINSDIFILKTSQDGKDLIFSSIIGGDKDEKALSLKVDSDGNAYVTGYTESNDFPVTNALFSSLKGERDAFVLKIDNTGNNLLFSTYLGGSANDCGNSIAVDSNGNAYITGYTESDDFPVTSSLYSHLKGDRDAFVLKLDNKGENIVYSMYLGGFSDDCGNGITVDSSGNAYITGYTESGDFPISHALFTHLKGYRDAFIAKLDDSGNYFIYSTFLGGSSGDSGNDISVDSTGRAYIIGETASKDFPMGDVYLDSYFKGGVDAFIAKLSPSGNILEFSTYIGGNLDDKGVGISCTPNTGVVVTGITNSQDFNVTDNSSFNKTGNYDIFVGYLEFSNNNGYYFSPISTTLIGGEGDDYATGVVADNLTFYLTGYSNSSDFLNCGETYDIHNKTGYDAFLIHGVLTHSNEPVIDSITVTENEKKPQEMIFQCLAHALGGRKIVKYIWDIERISCANAGVFCSEYHDRVITFENVCRYKFLRNGEFKLKVTVVDEDGNSSSKYYNEELKPSCYSYSIALPVSLFNFDQNEFSKISVDLINPYLYDTSYKIMKSDSNGNTSTYFYDSIFAKGKSQIVFTSSQDYQDFLLDFCTGLIVASKITTKTGMVAAYLSSETDTKLYVPHIAEETNYWETKMFVSSNNPTDLNIKIADQIFTSSIENFSTYINLEEFLEDNLDSEEAWGEITSSVSDSSSNTNLLSGFEIFSHNNTDGAAVELPSHGSKTLYIPHIPEETNIFWTGFVFVNPNEENADLTIELFDGDGNLIKECMLTIASKTKYKTLASDLFEDAFGEAEWGIIHSNQEIIGIEIYGTVANAICGYTLPNLPRMEGYFPQLLEKQNEWNGIAITNPFDCMVDLEIDLVSSTGNVLVAKKVTLLPKERFKAVVKNLFNDLELHSDYYIRYKASNPVIGIEVCGDLDRTYMFSLIGAQ